MCNIYNQIKLKAIYARVRPVIWKRQPCKHLSSAQRKSWMWIVEKNSLEKETGLRKAILFVLFFIFQQENKASEILR